MKKIAIALTILLFLSSISFGQSEADYEKSLVKMFEVSGSEEVFRTVIKQTMGMFKDNFPIDPEVWLEVEKEFMTTSFDDLVVLLVPIYKKYLTVDDLNGIITFYESPAGQSFAKHTPMITQESMQVGQMWGMQLGKKVEETLKQKGIVPKKE